MATETSVSTSVCICRIPLPQSNHNPILRSAEPQQPASQPRVTTATLKYGVGGKFRLPKSVMDGLGPLSNQLASTYTHTRTRPLSYAPDFQPHMPYAPNGPVTNERTNNGAAGAGGFLSDASDGDRSASAVGDRKPIDGRCTGLTASLRLLWFKRLRVS